VLLLVLLQRGSTRRADASLQRGLFLQRARAKRKPSPDSVTVSPLLSTALDFLRAGASTSAAFRSSTSGCSESASS
jgi:hypothetical protein